MDVAPFCMDVREVSAEEYFQCVQRGECAPPKVPGISNYASTGRARHPMDFVDWRSADRYCTARKARLPSSAEWGWAAGGNVSFPYPWGTKEPSAVDGCFAPGTIGTCEVGTRAQDRTPQGIVDLAGNVAEWTSSAHGTWPSLYKIIRGGSRRSLKFYAMPQYSPGELEHENVGFRCVRSI
jgi:sulfatase modifying factor 1